MGGLAIRVLKWATRDARRQQIMAKLAAKSPINSALSSLPM